ncbi:hypothetical protein BN1708_020708, partial [Verticillium longisporum]
TPGRTRRPDQRHHRRDQLPGLRVHNVAAADRRPLSLLPPLRQVPRHGLRSSDSPVRPPGHRLWHHSRPDHLLPRRPRPRADA